ncbi:MAG: hypothetical protein M0P66_04505 [Salinivirgaceae bacterium]|nr:hypothetical protein [Salinivirgaceae bacterium]
MRISLVFLLWVASFTAPAQDFSSIDAYARNTPQPKTKNADDLATYLHQQAITDLEKVRAYYVWITQNIAYDTKSYFSGKSNPETSPEATLKKRRAICQGYSELFKALCDIGNIPCFVVDGYSKGYGYKPGKKFNSTDHAWNVVQLNQKWYLIDATWGAGYVTEQQQFEQKFKEEYFLADPKKFILNHLPSDPMWQLLPCPLTMEEYLENDPRIEKIIESKSDCFSFADTINSYLQLEKTERMINSSERAYRFFPENAEPVGYAYMNLAYDLGLQLTPLYDSEEFVKALEVSRTILLLNERALKYFKESKTENGKNAYNMAKQNISSMKNSIKSLEDYLK